MCWQAHVGTQFQAATDTIRDTTAFVNQPAALFGPSAPLQRCWRILSNRADQNPHKQCQSLPTPLKTAPDPKETQNDLTRRQCWGGAHRSTPGTKAPPDGGIVVTATTFPSKLAATPLGRSAQHYRTSKCTTGTLSLPAVSATPAYILPGWPWLVAEVGACSATPRLVQCSRA